MKEHRGDHVSAAQEDSRLSAAALAAQRAELAAINERPVLSRFAAYTRLTGPGWLQSAITLGGGSLAGSLYLGVLGGFSLLWLQPLAMLLGIIMLSAIAYVTLSTGKRPFRAINEHVNPVLGWGWLIATLMANIVWCMPQFSLGTAAVLQNLLQVEQVTDGHKAAVCAVLLAAASVVIWFYDSGSWGIRVFEMILKCMVGLIVLCFFGVVLRIGLSGDGLPWGGIVAGLVPDIGLLVRPASTFDAALAATGEYAAFWTREIVAMQRDVMITATATAVGINMTFLLPYSMLKKGWGREHRELAVFDLSLGLFIPFVLATGCVVIAAATQFHAQPQVELLSGAGAGALKGDFNRMLTARVRYELGADLGTAATAAAVGDAAARLPEADRLMAAMLVKRDAFNLAASLERLTGRTFSHTVFGIGVVGMALSTIIILMLISGFTVCEMMNVPAKGTVHRLGCFIAGIGVLGPFIFKGRAAFWLAVPTSVFGMTLIPIAYLTFLLMMNSRNLMGSSMLRGPQRVIWNALMLVAVVLTGYGAAWSIWDKAKWYGVAIVVLFVGAAVAVHIISPPKALSED